MTTNQVSIDVPLALQHLIQANNRLLKSYQAQLTQEVQEANIQMMALLKLDPSIGWRLDMDQMKYIRLSQETQSPAE